MQEYLSFALSAFAGFFAIMNPIGGIPVFTSLVAGADQKERIQVARKAVSVALLIGLALILAGSYIFRFYGITIPSFKITGGFILFYSGFEMLQSKKTGIKHLNYTHFDENIAISPLAIPLLSGPGTIVTGMNFVSNMDYIHIIIVIIIFGMICYLNYLAFVMSNFIMVKLGRNIMTVISKVMGLIISIIGTQMMIEGIKIAFAIQ